jgi:hypothetical protein
MNSSVSRFIIFLGERSQLATAGAADKLVDDFEQTFHLALPSDFRQFLSVTNGTSEALGDGLTFWTIEDLKPLSTVLSGTECLDPRHPSFLPEASELYVFCDWLINSFCYAIHLGAGKDRGVVLFVDGSNSYRCASSFSQFLEIYMLEAQHPNFCGFLPEQAGTSSQ